MFAYWGSDYFSQNILIAMAIQFKPLLPEWYALFSLLTTKIALLKRARNHKLHDLIITIPYFTTVVCANHHFNEI